VKTKENAHHKTKAQRLKKVNSFLIWASSPNPQMFEVKLYPEVSKFLFIFIFENMLKR